MDGQALANLPYFLQALGRGSQGYVQGQDQADRHAALVQQMMMDRNQEGRAQQLFPIQMRGARDNLRRMEPMSGDVRASFNTLAPSINAPELGPDTTEPEGRDIYGLAASVAAAKANAGGRDRAESDKFHERFFIQAHQNYLNKIKPWQDAIRAAQAKLGTMEGSMPKVKDELNMTIQQNTERIAQAQSGLKHTFKGYAEVYGLDPDVVDQMFDAENQSQGF